MRQPSKRSKTYFFFNKSLIVRYTAAKTPNTESITVKIGFSNSSQKSNFRPPQMAAKIMAII